MSHVGCRSEIEFIKVWAHECMRVFHDRLIDQKDQDFFKNQLKNIVKENF